MIKCKLCGHEGNYWDFYADETYDSERNEVINVYACPECGNFDEEELEFLDERID